MTLLSKQTINQVLERLGELAEAQGQSIELLLVGGAAMVLMYNARASTHDVDVFIMAPPQARLVRALALNKWPKSTTCLPIG